MRLFSFSVLLWSLITVPSWSQDVTSAVRAEIDQAERELGLAKASLRRAAQRMEALQMDPETTDAQLLAMEEVVHELGELVKVREQTLQDLRSLAGESLHSPDPGVTNGMEAFESAVDSVPSTEPNETEQERLDREFAASLEEFDGMILAHNRKLEDRIAARSAKGEAQASTHQTAASEAEALLRSMGVDPGTGGSTGETAGTSQSGSEQSSVEETGTPGAVAGTSSEGPEAGGGRGQGGSRPPRENEDVVARQLREAAEKETDPELREKLWKEYEAYVDGRS